MPHIDEMDGVPEGWEDSGPEDIEKDVAMTWAECILSMPGMTVDDLGLKEKYKQHLRDEGYE